MNSGVPAAKYSYYYYNTETETETLFFLSPYCAIEISIVQCREVKTTNVIRRLKVTKTVKYTYNTFCIGLLHDSCQPQITNLNFTMVTIDKYIITLQVSVYDWGIMAVKII